MSYISDTLKLVKDGEPFTIESLAAGIACARNQARLCIRQLLGQGSIEAINAPGPGTPSWYRITAYGRLRVEQNIFRNRPRSDEARAERLARVRPVEIDVPEMTGEQVIAANRACRPANSVFALAVTS